MGHRMQFDRRLRVSCAMPAALVLSVLLHAGCASTDTDGWTVVEDDAARTVRHTVVAGDRLAIIARDVTGDATTWSAIAEHNGITDPRRLAIDTVIEIPGSMIPRAPSPAGETVAADASSRQASTAMAVATSDVPAAPAEPVVVMPVESNRNFDLAPLDKSTDERFNLNRFVKVIGTYYPRAIYAEPAGYSRLMVRVFPGTVLPLEREIGDWLRVTTDEGSGYLRSSDGEILSERERSASLDD